jgi:hypothetical protein
MIIDKRGQVGEFLKQAIIAAILLYVFWVIIKVLFLGG